MKAIVFLLLGLFTLSTTPYIDNAVALVLYCDGVEVDRVEIWGTNVIRLE